MPKITRAERLLLAFCRLEPAGLSPKAPGTMGSLAAVILAPFVFLPFSLPVRLGILLAIFIAGGLAATQAEKILGKKDHGSIVIDEVLGQWLAIIPFAALSWTELFIAFGLFRLFDITKPWPVKASETWLPAGFGIMLDDAFAGLYAALVMYLLKMFI